jgi:polyisoprenoid-binding protein YceI
MQMRQTTNRMKFACTILFLITSTFVVAQKYVVEKSKVVFFSHAAIEDIKAENKNVSGIFNSDSGEIVFSIPIKSFKFAKSLMQEHFNEKYLESDKFPKATFQGKIVGYDRTKRNQNVSSKGKLTIHGETREVEIPGTIALVGNKLQMTGKFIVRLADYNIAIPQLVWQNIAEKVEVTFDFIFKPESNQ